MANANVLEFTDKNFDAEVINSATPVLVDFWAEWCMPCRMLSPTIDAIASEMVGKVKVGKVDTDENKQAAMRFDITAIPTIIIFKAGKPVKRFAGITSKDEIVSAIKSVAG